MHFYVNMICGIEAERIGVALFRFTLFASKPFPASATAGLRAAQKDDRRI
jgi:hypothetical protein